MTLSCLNLVIKRKKCKHPGKRKILYIKSQNKSNYISRNNLEDLGEIYLKHWKKGLCFWTFYPVKIPFKDKGKIKSYQLYKSWKNFQQICTTRNVKIVLKAERNNKEKKNLNKKENRKTIWEILKPKLLLRED